ncbi:hypothetical protein [Geminicoccus flavidas]|uniref:hypothetical protein n=1 Tax=Geminicoccus flavidas TaxID=2506407 RepID=UPI00135A571C|nr:hypothetical protein [Geminicoccus flavidas]
MAVCLALVLFEVFLRTPPLRVGVSPVTYHPQLGYWHKADYQGQAFSACYSVPYRLDGHGLRPSRGPVPGKKAILLGDSQVEAVMVADEQVMHQRLQAHLGDRIEVLNYGLGGSGADLQHLVLQHLADLDQVGWVVQLVNLDSDVYEANPNNDKPGQRPRARLMFDAPADLDHFRLVPPAPFTRMEQFREVFSGFQLYSYSRAALLPVRRLIREVRQTLKGGQPPAVTDPAQPVQTRPSELSWTNLIGAIRQNQKLVAAHGGRYLALVWNRDPQLLAEWQRRTAPLGLQTLDLAPALARAGVDLEAASFPCDHHFTAATHDEIAKVLARSGFFGRS